MDQASAPSQTYRLVASRFGLDLFGPIMP